MPNKPKDKFQLFLDEMLEKLQTCQVSKGYKSCSLCEFYFGCEIRDEYVKAVYNSMSKGAAGGFEF
ncbi:hypothetical protein JHD46_06940 [Sulfurimonas sp. SAG-AH-194-C20]|nr:hypothetical protein [Sulfurimonas sp. SAG-AH-194-C20]MDF1879371.1 hypothetical protein [Sulfurimonas sp. SAG-AH-194-C20]